MSEELSVAIDEWKVSANAAVAAVRRFYVV